MTVENLPHTPAVGTVAVIGTGTMGRGIGRVFLAAGHQVRMYDNVPGLAASWVDSLPDGERLDDAGRPRISASDDLATLATGADLVVEVVAEDREVKAEVLQAVSAHAPDDCVIATNTSSYPIDDLAKDCRIPERFVGMHFFNPADAIPGVEVIPSDVTAPAVVERVRSWLTAAGKRPATVRSSPGFIANRLQMALFLESARCVEEGLVTPEDLDTVVSTTFGFRLPLFGPFKIADMAGLDVYRSIFATLEEGLGEGFAAPASLVERTERGEFGLKTGQGYSSYGDDEREPLVASRDAAYRELTAFLDGLESTRPAPREEDQR